jgi:hypothetical protein
MEGRRRWRPRDGRDSIQWGHRQEGFVEWRPMSGQRGAGRREQGAAGKQAAGRGEREAHGDVSWEWNGQQRGMGHTQRGAGPSQSGACAGTAGCGRCRHRAAGRCVWTGRGRTHTRAGANISREQERVVCVRVSIQARHATLGPVNDGPRVWEASKTQ